MPIEIAEIIGIVAIVTIIGVLLVSIPITRRLGRGLEEWMRIRAEGAVGQTQIDQLDEQVRSLGRHVDALEQRLQLLSDRQDFTESLVEANADRKSIPGGGS